MPIRFLFLITFFVSSLQATPVAYFFSEKERKAWGDQNLGGLTEAEKKSLGAKIGDANKLISPLMRAFTKDFVECEGCQAEIKELLVGDNTFIVPLVADRKDPALNGKRYLVTYNKATKQIESAAEVNQGT